VGGPFCFSEQRKLSSSIHCCTSRPSLATQHFVSPNFCIEHSVIPRPYSVVHFSQFSRPYLLNSQWVHITHTLPWRLLSSRFFLLCWLAQALITSCIAAEWPPNMVCRPGVWRSICSNLIPVSLSDAKSTDPPLLERSSEVKSYTTSRATYNGLRVFYRRHPQADKLPKDPAPIPLLVFVHGLGGSVAQFNSLLTSLTPIASCLAVDLPGCGVSKFTNTSWDAYTTDSLVELLETIIDDYREKEDGQSVVLIGHSMGASLAALLACPRAKTRSELHKHTIGLVAVCPKSEPPTEDETWWLKKLLYVPELIFDMWRAWDRRGGLDSASVRRFVGADADPEAKRLQHLYNCQSRTPVWRRMAWGMLPRWHNGLPEGGLPTGDVWSQLDLPVFLLGGEGDNVCKPENVHKIAELIRGDKNLDGDEPTNNTADLVDTDSLASERNHAFQSGSPPGSVSNIRAEDFVRVKLPSDNGESSEDPVTPEELAQSIPPLSLRPTKSVEEIVLRKPATHALLYTPSTAPILAGLISDFLATKITGRLALGWQLQYLCRDGKWDVKNLEKWKSVAPVSEPIGGVFRAIKTLREVDEVHCPHEFVRNWGRTIQDVIDISHDNPVYDPQGLEDGGIRYRMSNHHPAPFSSFVAALPWMSQHPVGFYLP